MGLAKEIGWGIIDGFNLAGVWILAIVGYALLWFIQIMALVLMILQAVGWCLWLLGHWMIDKPVEVGVM